MLSRQRIADLLKEAGVFMEGHFLLTSGRHSDKYMQSARIFQNYRYGQELCSVIAEQYKGRVDLVVSLAIGAIQMGYELSRQLDCENIFAERENGVMTLRRGFSVQPGQRVLVAENVITTGGTVKELLPALKGQGADIAGVAVIVDRSAGEIDFGVPLTAVYADKVESWEADDCPLCKKGIELVKPGSRKF